MFNSENFTIETYIPVEEGVEVFAVESSETRSLMVYIGDFYVLFLYTVNGWVLVGEGQQGDGLRLVENEETNNVKIERLFENGKMVWESK